MGEELKQCLHIDQFKTKRKELVFTRYRGEMGGGVTVSSFHMVTLMIIISIFIYFVHR